MNLWFMILTCLSQNIFTIVEEIFEFWWSEIHPNEAFQNVNHRISSPWLKKILDFDDLKCSRMKDFNMFITKYLHNSWRDFWILIIWNTPEWRISKSIRIEKIFFLPQWAFMDHIETQHRFYWEFKCHYTLFLIRNWL